MFTRKADKSIESWFYRKGHKPLLLRGARQVGKTTLVENFSKRHKIDLVKFNFEEAPELKKIFKKDLNVKRIVADLNVVSGKKINSSNLLYFDEIQECPEAVQSLRYFYENSPEINLVASGSLLDFQIEKIGLPVGRIELLYLYPFSFYEFLEVTNHGHLLEIINNYELGSEISEIAHKRILELLNLYMVIGGMPEVVKKYVESFDLELVQRVQTQLINIYREDFNKYSRKSQISDVEDVFITVPRFLSQKFKYRFVNADKKSLVISNAINLLVKAGIIRKAVHSNGNGVPLGAETKANLFKLFLLDVGLANRVLNLNLKDFIANERLGLANKGGLAEQFVAGELVLSASPSSPYELYFWDRQKPGSVAEVDFLIQTGQKVLPLEVKSGLSRSSKSLQVFLNEKESSPMAVELSIDLPYKKPKVMFLPLYMSGRLEELFT